MSKTNFTIKARMMAMVLTVILFQIIAVAVQFWDHKKGDAILDSLSDEIMPLSLTIKELRSKQSSSVRFVWASLGSSSQEQRAGSLAIQKTQLQEFGEEIASASKLKYSTESFKETLAGFKAFHEVISKFDLSEKADPAEVEKAREWMWTTLVPAARKLDQTSSETAAQIQTSLNNLLVAKEQYYTQSGILVWLVPSTSVIAIIALALLQISSIQGFLMNLTSSLRNLGDRFTDASHQLNQSASSLSSGATENAASLEETVSSLEELSSMVDRNAENSRQASMLAQTSRKSAETGAEDINGLISSIHDIASQSTKIEEIIAVIDGISFQTNLLALNAAVEAARAGEQGKGFAVVADAVRNLAQKSSEAAKNISTLIKESVEKSQTGVQQATRAGETLNRIVSDAIKVADLVSEIASASSEQAQGVGQISKAMNQLDSVTQANAASAQQTADSSMTLSSDSDELQSLLNQLGAFMIGGTRADAAGSDASAEASVQAKPHSTQRSQTRTSQAFAAKGSAKNSSVRSSKAAVTSKSISAGNYSATTRSSSSSAKSPGKTVASSAAMMIPFDSDDFDEKGGSDPKLGNASGF